MQQPIPMRFFSPPYFNIHLKTFPRPSAALPNIPPYTPILQPLSLHAIPHLPSIPHNPPLPLSLSPIYLYTAIYTSLSPSRAARELRAWLARAHGGGGLWGVGARRAQLYTSLSLSLLARDASDENPAACIVVPPPALARPPLPLTRGRKRDILRFLSS